MKAVILAAGVGSRMGKLTQKISKVMLPLRDKPLLEHHVLLLKKFGIKEICINIHHQPQSITDYFKDGKDWGINIIYSFEKTLQGTAGALKFFTKYLDERFFLFYGDVYTNINIAKMEQFHLKKGASVTIAVHPSSHPDDSDLVDVDETMKLIKIYYKPHPSYTTKGMNLAGVYILEPRVLELLPFHTPSDFEREFLPKILEKNNNIFCYNTKDVIKDIGTPNRYRQLIHQ